MAKAVFIQYWMMDHLGVMTVCAAVKRHGHRAEILVKHEENDLVGRIKSMNPDVVGFTCTTGIHEMALKDIRRLKEVLPDMITLMGGSHPTFSPEVIHEPGLDVICRGEGEGAINDLCDRIDQKQDYTDVKNLWVKQGGTVHKNDLRPLIQNLDDLPFPDRSHYERYPVLKKMPNRYIATGRGCVYNCSFCSNGALMSMYKGKGRFVRRRSTEHVLRELEHIRDHHFVKCFSFEDDDFLDNQEWIMAFFPEYKKRIGLPYICLGRFDNISEEVVRCLKASGCYLLELGIDSGNEKIRQKLLNKSLPNAKIIEGAAILKKYGLTFRTYNILGLPNETIDDAFDTLDLNVKIKTDFPAAFLWQPYPETALAKSVSQPDDGQKAQNGFSPTFNEKSLLAQANIRELENFQKLFPLLARAPYSRSVIERCIKMHWLKPLYDALYHFIYLIDISKVFRFGILRTIDYGLRMRKMY